MEASSIPFRSHTALLLAAALPHLAPALNHQTELALKALELLETLKFYQRFPFMDETAHSSFSHNTEKEAGILGLIQRFIQDPEGLLQKLSDICTGKELEIVSMLLNILRAKSFYDTYGDALQLFMSSAAPEAFTNAQSSEETPVPENPHGFESAPFSGNPHGSENAPPSGNPHGFENAPFSGNPHGSENAPPSGNPHGFEGSPPTADTSAFGTGNFATMLNNEQKETLEFLKNLLENEA